MEDRFVARANDLLVEQLDGGLVVYDKRRDHAHWLDKSATAVWLACREPRSEAQIARDAGLDAKACEVVLAHLTDLGLLETDADAGYSRRTVLRTAAKVGIGGAVAAPIISAVVPVAAAHASTVQGGGGVGGGGQCTGSYPVQSGSGQTRGTPDLHNTVYYQPGGGQASGPPFPTGSGAFNVPNPPNGGDGLIGGPPWADPIETSNWITDTPNGDHDDEPVGYYYYTSTSPFLIIPSCATSASISGSFYSDNAATLYINNVNVASNSGNVEPYSPPATAFTAALHPGVNTLQFEVYNNQYPYGNGGPTGLDYYATVTYS